MSFSLLGSYTNQEMCTIYCPYTWLTKDFFLEDRNNVSWRGNKSWTTNTCRLLLLLFAIHTFSAQSIRGLQLLKSKKKLLADRDRNTGESTAHKWGLLLAVSTGAEMPFSGEGMSLLLACLLSLCSLQTYSEGVIWSFLNLQSGFFSRLSFLCKCRKKSFHTVQGIPAGGWSS